MFVSLVPCAVALVPGRKISVGKEHAVALTEGGRIFAGASARKPRVVAAVSAPRHGERTTLGSWVRVTR